MVEETKFCKQLVFCTVYLLSSASDPLIIPLLWPANIYQAVPHCSKWQSMKRSCCAEMFKFTSPL